MDLREVLDLTGATVIRWPGTRRVSPIRRVRHAGPGTLYVPMFRTALDESVLTELVRAGAAGVMLYDDQPGPSPEDWPALGFLAVRSPYQAYYRLAAVAREQSKALVVGITGSSGKSSVKEYLATILGGRYRVHATRSSKNEQENCADLLLALADQGDAAVIEMGFGRVGDLDEMGQMATPDAGVITGITPDHLDGTGGSYGTLVREKGRLGLYIPPGGVLALDADNSGCAKIDRSPYRCKVLTFGQGSAADLRYHNVVASEAGTSLTLDFFGQRVPCQVQNFGAVQAANAAAAALVAHALGVPIPEIRRGLAETPPLPRRFTIHRFADGLTLIDDTFKANPGSARAGLAHAARLAGSRKRIAVLTGIGDLGEREEFYHRTLGGWVVKYRYTHLWLLFPDERTEAIRAGALAAGMRPDQIYTVEERAAIVPELLRAAGPDTVLYCKASQRLWIGPQLDDLMERLVAVGYERVGRT